MNHRSKFSRFGAAALATTGALVASGQALAGDMATAITTEVATAKAEILLVAVVMLGITGVLLLVKSVRRAAH